MAIYTSLGVHRRDTAPLCGANSQKIYSSIAADDRSLVSGLLYLYRLLQYNRLNRSEESLYFSLQETYFATDIFSPSAKQLAWLTSILHRESLIVNSVIPSLFGDMPVVNGDYYSVPDSLGAERSPERCFFQTLQYFDKDFFDGCSIVFLGDRGYVVPVATVSRYDFFRCAFQYHHLMMIPEHNVDESRKVASLLQSLRIRVGAHNSILDHLIDMFRRPRLFVYSVPQRSILKEKVAEFAATMTREDSSFLLNVFGDGKKLFRPISASVAMIELEKAYKGLTM